MIPMVMLDDNVERKFKTMPDSNIDVAGGFYVTTNPNPTCLANKFLIIKEEEKDSDIFKHHKPLLLGPYELDKAERERGKFLHNFIVEHTLFSTGPKEAKKNGSWDESFSPNYYYCVVEAGGRRSWWRSDDGVLYPVLSDTFLTRMISLEKQNKVMDEVIMLFTDLCESTYGNEKTKLTRPQNRGFEPLRDYRDLTFTEAYKKERGELIADHNRHIKERDDKISKLEREVADLKSKLISSNNRNNELRKEIDRALDEKRHGITFTIKGDSKPEERMVSIDDTKIPSSRFSKIDLMDIAELLDSFMRISLSGERWFGAPTDIYHMRALFGDAYRTKVYSIILINYRDILYTLRKAVLFKGEFEKATLSSMVYNWRSEEKYLNLISDDDIGRISGIKDSNILKVVNAIIRFTQEDTPVFEGRINTQENLLECLLASHIVADYIYQTTHNKEANVTDMESIEALYI